MDGIGGAKTPAYVIEVLIENRSEDIIDYCATDFIAQDSDGFAYEPRIGTQMYLKQALGTTKKLSPGLKAKGYVAFDGIPKGSVVSSIVHLMDNAPVGIWDVTSAQ